MKERELKKLKRADLLEMLIDLSKENKALREKLADQKSELAQRKIDIEKAGSIAEASLALNGVFDAAQKASEQYLENIERLSVEQERLGQEIIGKSQAEADRLLRETEHRCRVMEETSKEKSARLLEDAEKKSQAYWDQVSSKLDAFYQAHEELKGILPVDLTSSQ